MTTNDGRGLQALTVKCAEPGCRESPPPRPGANPQAAGAKSVKLVRDRGGAIAGQQPQGQGLKRAGVDVGRVARLGRPGLAEIERGKRRCVGLSQRRTNVHHQP